MFGEEMGDRDTQSIFLYDLIKKKKVWIEIFRGYIDFLIHNWQSNLLDWPSS